MYGLGPEKSLRLVYEIFYLAIALLFKSSSRLCRFPKAGTPAEALAKAGGGGGSRTRVPACNFNNLQVDDPPVTHQSAH